MRRSGLLLFIAICAMTACSGGSGGTLPPALLALLPSAAPTQEAIDSSTIEIANGIGAPLKDYESYEESLPPAAAANGGCNGNASFSVPDSLGDANSSESKFYYLDGCQLLARDVIRVISHTGQNAETVTQTIAINLPQSSGPSPLPTTIPSPIPSGFYTLSVRPYLTRMTTEHLTSADFDGNGYPNVIEGYQRSASSSLVQAGSTYFSTAGTTLVQTIDGLDILPAPLDQNGNPTNTNTFCDETAGYVLTDFIQDNETFGWSGGILAQGLRTRNSDGTVTWAGTHTGSGSKGAPSSYSLNQNGFTSSLCPIVNAVNGLNGGSAGGSYSLPISATFTNGTLTDLTLNNASLPNGFSISFTKESMPIDPTGYIFVGALKQNGNAIANIIFDSFGSGAIQILPIPNDKQYPSGRQYTIADFHVIK